MIKNVSGVWEYSTVVDHLPRIPKVLSSVLSTERNTAEENVRGLRLQVKDEGGYPAKLQGRQNMQK